MSPKKIKQQAQEKIHDLFGEVMKRVPMSELNLPKEVVTGIVANLEKVRQGALTVFSHELQKVFANVDMTTLVTEIAKNYTLRINAEFKLEPRTKIKRKKKT